jgi:hypothetical protein
MLTLNAKIAGIVPGRTPGFLLENANMFLPENSALRIQ